MLKNKNKNKNKEMGISAHPHPFPNYEIVYKIVIILFLNGENLQESSSPWGFLPSHYFSVPLYISLSYT